MKKTIRICDVCIEDDRNRKAVAWYRDVHGIIRDACKECLKVIKKSKKLKYYMYKEEEL